MREEKRRHGSVSHCLRNSLPLSAAKEGIAISCPCRLSFTTHALDHGTVMRMAGTKLCVWCVMAGNGKKRKQGKKKREEQQQPPEQATAPVSGDSVGGMAMEGNNKVTPQQQSPSRNDDSEIDDDDVPSELLPVHWRNPALDVEIEIEDPPDIAVLIPGEAGILPFKESSQPEQLKELILEQSEQYFEDPFSSSESPESLVDSGETSSKRQGLCLGTHRATA